MVCTCFYGAVFTILFLKRYHALSAWFHESTAFWFVTCRTLKDSGSFFIKYKISHDISRIFFCQVSSEKGYIFSFASDWFSIPQFKARKRGFWPQHHKIQYIKEINLTQKKQVLCDLRTLFLIFNCQTPGLTYSRKYCKKIDEILD